MICINHVAYSKCSNDTDGQGLSSEETTRRPSWSLRNVYRNVEQRLCVLQAGSQNFK